MIFSISLFLIICFNVFMLWPRHCNDYNRNSESFGSRLAAGFFVSLIVGLFGCLMFPCIFENCSKKTEVRRENLNWPIYSLKENNEIRGNFFLGSGGINSTEYYYTFTKNERDGFSRWQINENNAIIYQDVKPGGQPYVSRQKIISKYSKIGFPWDKFEESFTSFDIHVPADTIIEKYKVE